MYDGLIRIGVSNNSPYPAIPYGLFAILICLFIKFMRYSILSYHAVWQPALLVGMFLVAVLMVANRNFSSVPKARVMGIILITLCSFAYGFCTVVTLNCLYDHSNSQFFRARVLNKWVSRGKGTAYNFKISQWREGGNKENIIVSRGMFERVGVEDPINVYVYQGLLKIPWYVISDQ